MVQSVVPGKIRERFPRLGKRWNWAGRPSVRIVGNRAAGYVHVPRLNGRTLLDRTVKYQANLLSRGGSFMINVPRVEAGKVAVPGSKANSGTNWMGNGVSSEARMLVHAAGAADRCRSRCTTA